MRDCLVVESFWVGLVLFYIFDLKGILCYVRDSVLDLVFGASVKILNATCRRLLRGGYGPIQRKWRICFLKISKTSIHE